MVDTGKASRTRQIRKRVVRRPGDLQKCLSLGRLRDAVRHDKRQIPGGRRVEPLALHGIQPVWRDIICILAADLSRLLVHELRKLLHTAAHMLRDRHRGVVVGLQHQGECQIPQAVLLTAAHPQTHLGHGRRVGGHLHRIIQAGVLQCDDQRHDLRRARHRHLLVSAALIQHPSRVRIHEHCRLCIESEIRLIRMDVHRLPHQDRDHHGDRQQHKFFIPHIFLHTSSFPYYKGSIKIYEAKRRFSPLRPSPLHGSYRIPV